MRTVFTNLLDVVGHNKVGIVRKAITHRISYPRRLAVRFLGVLFARN
jgi:hypothetical protein